MTQGELSLAEITTYLESKVMEYRIESVSEKIAILNADINVNNIMNNLSGFYKIGDVKCVFNSEDITNESKLEKKLNSIEFYSWLDDKIRWCISVYKDGEDFEWDIIDHLQDYFKERLKKDNVKKAKYIIPKKLKEIDQEIISDDIVKKHIIENGLEIIVAYISGKYYIGRTLDVIRNHEFKSRDFERPFQNPKESIPPKIARILVNLTGVHSGDMLLDPFCGIGTILQEASILGIQVYGVDIDRQRVFETVSNLQWINEKYNLQMTNIYDRILTSDSRNLSTKIHVQMDGIATEPILIPPLKKFPSKREAEDMLDIARKSYEEIIPEMVNVLKKGKRLVLVVPYLRTDKHRELSLDLEEVFKESGLVSYRNQDYLNFNYPLRGFSDKDQKVLRGIYVLEKF